jgi:RNA polymerase sigma-70 factor (ECF subfamily)
VALTGEKVPTAVDAPLHSSDDRADAALPASSTAGAVTAWQDDLRLMTLVAAGNPEAMNIVARRLSPRVRRLSRVIVRNDALADDAAQVALVEILQSARTYGGRSSLERWADRITARVTLRQVREERRRFEVVDSLDEPEKAVEPPSPESDPAESARSQTPRALEEYLKAIPEAQREALILKHSLGHTVEEIAEITGVPVGTVKDRLVTARRQVRRLIQRDLTLGQGTRKNP